MEVRVIQGVGLRGGRRDWLLSPRWSEFAPNTANVPPIFVVMAEAAQVQPDAVETSQIIVSVSQVTFHAG